MHVWLDEASVKVHIYNSYVNDKSEYSGVLCMRALAGLGFTVRLVAYCSVQDFYVRLADSSVHERLAVQKC